MKLQEFLSEEKISPYLFARMINSSIATVYNILKEKNDITLSVALAIETATKGKVKIPDLTFFEREAIATRPPRAYRLKKCNEHDEKKESQKSKSK